MCVDCNLSQKVLLWILPLNNVFRNTFTYSYPLSDYFLKGIIFGCYFYTEDSVKDRHPVLSGFRLQMKLSKFQVIIRTLLHPSHSSDQKAMTLRYTLSKLGDNSQNWKHNSCR